MKSILFKLFLLAHATFCVGQTSLIQDWESFVDPEGYFEGFMPDSSTTRSTTVATALGELEYVTVTSEATFDEGVVVRYIISYCDYPEGLFHPDSIELIEVFFDETIRGATESVEGELIYTSTPPNAKFPTRLWKISSQGFGQEFKNKAFLVGDRYYLLQVVYPSSASVALNRSDEFFDSFKVRIE